MAESRTQLVTTKRGRDTERILKWSSPLFRKILNNFSNLPFINFLAARGKAINEIMQIVMFSLSFCGFDNLCCSSPLYYLDFEAFLLLWIAYFVRLKWLFEPKMSQLNSSPNSPSKKSSDNSINSPFDIKPTFRCWNPRFSTSFLHQSWMWKSLGIRTKKILLLSHPLANLIFIFDPFLDIFLLISLTLSPISFFPTSQVLKWNFHDFIEKPHETS